MITPILALSMMTMTNNEAIITYHMEQDPPLWYEVFKQFICQIYTTFGGDCNDLDWGDGGSTAVSQVYQRAATTPPQEPIDDLLNDLEAHIYSPESTISPQVTQETQELIDYLR